MLVADDEEMNRRVISRFLKSSYTIIEAEDGAKAWEIINSQHVDALLLDIIMPIMDGLEVLKALREHKEFDHISVLVATSTKEKTERSALSLGADDIVAKPYDPLVIERRLENVITMKEAQYQKNLLADQSYDQLLEDERRRLKTETEEIASRIKKYIAIINANKDNFKLVAEITAEIDKEASALSDVFVNRN